MCIKPTYKNAHIWRTHTYARTQFVQFTSSIHKINQNGSQSCFAIHTDVLCCAVPLSSYRVIYNKKKSAYTTLFVGCFLFLIIIFRLNTPLFCLLLLYNTIVCLHLSVFSHNFCLYTILNNEKYEESIGSVSIVLVVYRSFGDYKKKTQQQEVFIYTENDIIDRVGPSGVSKIK